MKSGIVFAVVALALLNLGAMEVTTETPLVKTLECLRDNAPPQLSVADVRLEAQGERVTTRQLSARFVSRRDAEGLRAMLHVTAPADLAGTRYLLVEEADQDALYVYLPALGKTRRLSAGGADGEIAGTTLNVADLRLISQLFRASSISLERRTTWQGRPAQVLRFSPTVADSPYRRVLATIDEQTCVAIEADFQDAKATVKTYRVESGALRQVGRYWYASRSRVQDLQQGSRVDIALGQVRVDRKPSARSLDPRSFHKAD